MPEKILIVEDEPSIQKILFELLSDAGYSVSAAGDGEKALSAFQAGDFDLVILDIMLPKLDGYRVLKEIRERSDTPVIMLTALDGEEAEIKAFELRADDYITKPFSVKLVLLRVEAVLRRKSEKQKNAPLSYREIRLYPDSMRAEAFGKEIALTKIEFELLRLFMSNPERVFTRENLINTVWGYDYMGDEKAVNIHIMNLRRKLGFDPIETVRGVGYRLAKTEK